MRRIQAEYIWIDGQTPTADLRSKTKIINGPISRLEDIPDWGFDGSSTEQAEGHFSDCKLSPVYYRHDPIRGGSNILVMCEVMNPNGSAHPSNTRHILGLVHEKHEDQQCLFGIEQEFTLFKLNGLPLAWPDFSSQPAPQGKYYCGVGAGKIFGRQLIEVHRQACLDADLAIDGTNPEVMPGQHEVQIGPLSALDVCDQLYISRWLMHRIGEDFDIVVDFSPKPKEDGDWNGAGGHVNFSTRAMRDPGGLAAIKTACRKLGGYHEEHIAVYGSGNDKRLTGKHETCSINEFLYGVSDRGASIRIPMSTANNGKGYLEDRRPAANLDPYKVCTALIETVCGFGFDPTKHGWK